MQRKIIHSNFVDSKSPDELNLRANHYMLIDGEQIVDLVPAIPQDWSKVTVLDYSTGFVMPGFVDLHCHVPQFVNRGIGIGMELLDWLHTYTFPEESRFADADYRRLIFKRLINAFWRHGSLASVVFATIHKAAAIDLINMFEQSGLRSFVGKVNMDSHSPDYYIEQTVDSIADTVAFVEATKHNKMAKPIITPRFVPSCSRELLTALGKIAADYNLPVQSHLSENKKEIAWVAELFPDCQSYADVYRQHDLWRPDYQTVMAHCVWPTSREKELLRASQVVVAHCPQSNGNLASGIAPITELLDYGIPVALGSDISGGHEVSISRAMQMALTFSNLYWVHVDTTARRLSFANAFYMATRAGGKFFGNLGDFKKGRLADFLAIDDSALGDCQKKDLSERLQRFIYCGDDRQIVARFVGGRQVDEPYADV